MIVVDTSALFAIFTEEADAETYVDVIAEQERVLIGAPTAFEFQLVSFRKLGAEGLLRAIKALERWQLEIVAWDDTLLDHATDALRRFGTGPTRLNYGDCMAYALAKSLDVPLLYKGKDFAATDIRPALG